MANRFNMFTKTMGKNRWCRNNLRFRIILSLFYKPFLCHDTIESWNLFTRNK